MAEDTPVEINVGSGKRLQLEHVPGNKYALVEVGRGGQASVTLGTFDRDKPVRLTGSGRDTLITVPGTIGMTADDPVPQFIFATTDKTRPSVKGRFKPVSDNSEERQQAQQKEAAAMAVNVAGQLVTQSGSIRYPAAKAVARDLGEPYAETLKDMREAATALQKLTAKKPADMDQEAYDAAVHEAAQAFHTKLGEARAMLDGEMKALGGKTDRASIAAAQYARTSIRLLDDTERKVTEAPQMRNDNPIVADAAAAPVLRDPGTRAPVRGAGGDARLSLDKSATDLTTLLTKTPENGGGRQPFFERQDELRAMVESARDAARRMSTALREGKAPAEEDVEKYRGKLEEARQWLDERKGQAGVNQAAVTQISSVVNDKLATLDAIQAQLGPDAAQPGMAGQRDGQNPAARGAARQTAAETVKKLGDLHKLPAEGGHKVFLEGGRAKAAGGHPPVNKELANLELKAATINNALETGNSPTQRQLQEFHEAMKRTQAELRKVQGDRTEGRGAQEAAGVIWQKLENIRQEFNTKPELADPGVSRLRGELQGIRPESQLALGDGDNRGSGVTVRGAGIPSGMRMG